MNLTLEEKLRDRNAYFAFSKQKGTRAAAAQVLFGSLFGFVAQDTVANFDN